MNNPPFFTKGMYARYKALLSLMVRVNSPGLLLGLRNYVSFRSSVRQGGTAAEEQGFQCQLLVHAGRCETPQLAGGVQKLE
jgi:hypothetical protein